MKAAVLRKPHQPLAIEEVALDDPADREILVRTVATGVCHSDLHFIDGHVPISFLGDGIGGVVLGHEGAGIVESVGAAVTGFAPGDHVVVCLSSFCGQCESCLSGHPNRCRFVTGVATRPASEPPRISQNGEELHQFMDIASFAEYMLVHENSAVRIDKDVPLAHAALLSCGVLTGLGAALRTAAIRATSTVAVIGCGGVGLAIAHGAELAGARQIIGVDIFDSKLEMAEMFGATHTVNARREDPVEAIRGLTSGRGVDYSFDALGRVELTKQAVECLTHGGTATIVGTMSPNETLDLRANALFIEKRLQSSHMGSNRFRFDIPNYLDLYRQGRLKLAQMVTHQLPLDGVNEAFRLMQAGESLRSVLVFD
jgi:S-(hydroxymethyl)glutathione dehydrogenase / alcohol dehydrogenase